MDKLISRINGIKIAGIAAAVSNTHTLIDSFAGEIDPMTIKKFKKMTGVYGRYDAGPKQCTSDFCFAAANELLKVKKVPPEEIGAVVFVTQTPDYVEPATACVLHHRLGIGKNCIAFDVNLGCSGYVYGLSILGSIMASSNINRALLLAGDTSAKIKYDWLKQTENSFNLLFGDSGTATLLEKDSGSDDMVFMLRTDGSGYQAIINPVYSCRHPRCTKKMMDDAEVFNFTISDVPEIVKEYFEHTGTDVEDFDCFAPHQANLFILKQLAKRTGIPMDKVLVSLDEYGNTSSSSIPLTLAKHYGDSVRDQNIKALACGFGIGLSWGICSMKINANDILPVLHTDEYFDDGIEDA